MKRTIWLLVVVWATATAWAAQQFVIFQPQADALSLQDARVGFMAQEHSCVQKAAANLLEDIARVTGNKPATDVQQPTILIGTVGVNKQVDRWVKSGELRDLKGKTEKYIIKTIGDQLVIAGSDKRGTVFGIYELSQQMGVSPWYWWMDVPVVHHDALYIKRGEYTDGEPRVRYRGLFLNDEAPCLTSWVKNTFGTAYGDHHFYEKVFELILRLKGNFLWPAMWQWAFYADDALNSKTADEMGIIIGTSHHEPMARNHQEYARRRGEWGPWNYQKNQQKLDQFFREGIERMKGTDDIVTIGMRGDGDEAMSEDADTKLLQRIVENQRKIIKQVTGKPAKNTPQVWALYKEVLDYYDKGMRVPDDVLILLCDDNWGNVRRVPTAKERQHPGGWGLYYHVDYVGAPRNSKWLNVTPTQNMWEQLTLAAAGGLDRMWILNVGDLKPMEYPITLFMDMAWNPRCVGVDNITDHTMAFCREFFGEQQAAEAARILNLACKYAGRSTAEMLDATTYNVNTGEWRQVADDYMRLEAEALRQYLTIDEAHRDAYQQIILFPVQAMGNIYDMYYSQAMNQKLARNNDPAANYWAERCERDFKRDAELCAYYNKEMSGGKWNGMMIQKHIGYTSWNDNFRADTQPRVSRVEKGEKEGGYVFTEKNGVVAMEAEHFYAQTGVTAGSAKWTTIPYMGRTLSGVALMPYSQPTDGATMTYKFNLTEDVENLSAVVAVNATLTFYRLEGHRYMVSLDGGQEIEVVFNERLNEDQRNIYSVYYPTVATRVKDDRVQLGKAAKGEHTITFRPIEPGTVFEKVVIDAGGYIKSYLFMPESPYVREQ